MPHRSEIPTPAHQPGDHLHGFVVERVTPVEDIKALVYETRHEKTGAQLVHVHCNDEENLFSVGFVTPPPDSTGVAHILEHSVLAGSETYPVKDAFNELGKRTLNTFLNAMTWPDRTVYPTSSAVKADYFNLASVYMDLVFNPLLEPETFKQEGHHLELEDLDDPDSPLKISGVVYNEMKGANSSPERMLYRETLKALMEDTPYAHDSGGDPAVMPELTYEQFKDFHRRFYSPSNARFFLYGDVPLAQNLDFVSERLENFERIEVDSSIPVQARWSEPRRDALTYSIGTDEDPADKTFVTVSWLTNDTLDVTTSLLMEIAVDALYGSSGAPLRKALVDSGLGQAPYPGGAYGGSGQQTSCTFGLRGSNAEHVDAIETLILDTLARVVDEGLDREKIEASFHQIELSGKEISPPFPIQLLMRANPVWYFGGDPKDGLQFATLVERAREAWEAEPGIFERLLREWLIENPHRHTLVMAPEPGLAAKEEAELAAEMEQRKANLTADDIEHILTEAKALKTRQNTPDGPEQLSSLPVLEVDDIPKEPRTFETVESTLSSGATLLEHPSFSNDVAYIGLAFDTRDLSAEEALYVPFVGRAIRGLGAAGLDYGDMSTRISRYTGGIGLSPTTGRHMTSGERFERICVDGSALTRNAEMYFTILGELLFETDTSDHKRIRDMLQQSAAHKASSVVPSGHAYARTRAAATLDPVLWRNEQWGGLTQLRFLKGAAADDGAAEAIAERIDALRAKLFTRSRVIASLAGDPEAIEAVRPHLDAFVAGLPEGEAVQATDSTLPSDLSRHVGVSIPAKVNYVTQAFVAPNMLDEAAPALELLANVLKAEYLYKRIRVQGGAYGGFAGYSKDSGLFSLLSYRDPRLVETFDVFAGAVDWLRSDAFKDAMVDESRIGTIGNYDYLVTAAQMVSVGRRRRWLGLGEDARKQFRDGLFTCSADDIRRLAIPVLEAGLADSPRAVCAPIEALQAANESLDTPLDVESMDG